MPPQRLGHPGGHYVSPGLPRSGPQVSRSRDRDDDDDRPIATGGKIRTMCVRTCDGYYFPISFATSRRNLHRDAKACAASCGEDAKLFYHPTASGDVEGMVDMSGRPYSRMPNAFKYRQTLIAGCSCKPMPWAESELARHREYAMLEAEARREREIKAAQSPPAKVASKGTPRPAPVEEPPQIKVIDLLPNGERRTISVEVAKAMPPDEMAVEEEKARDATLAEASTSAIVAADSAEADHAAKPPSTPAAPAAPTPAPPMRTAEQQDVPARPARKSREQRRAERHAADQGPSKSARSQRQAPPPRPVKTAATPAYAGFAPQAKAKYVWPGDAPSRYR